MAFCEDRAESRAQPMTSVAIIDYGTGNVHSVGRMLTQLGVPWVYSRNAEELREATHLLMPGVGHCGTAMNTLRTNGTDRVLADLVLGSGVPVLGICLGMQLMTAHSEEGATDCLGWFDADTVRLAPVDKHKFKVPNMGWHLIDAVLSEPCFAGIQLASQPFYFCHGYGVHANDSVATAATFSYERSYSACLRRGNILGVQFHPEKSQDAGVTLMRNFLRMERYGV